MTHDIPMVLVISFLVTRDECPSSMYVSLLFEVTVPRDP